MTHTIHELSLLFYGKSRNYRFFPERVRVPRTEKSLRRAANPTGARISASDTTKLPTDVWADVPAMNPMANERTGYPTQKPLALYERIIAASSSKGDIVLDPFAGCATTCVAAERLEREWIGIDIWEKAAEVIIERLNAEGLFAPKKTRRTPKDQQMFLFAEDFHFLSKLPKRTDDNEQAAPHLRVKVRVHEPAGARMSRAAMYEHLLDQHGMKCQGCDRTFDDPRYLELDHNTPRADGGINHISNRILLCGPCNRLKSNTFTLSGLRRENKKRGYIR